MFQSKKQDTPYQNHRKREDLPHSETKSEVPDSCIGESYEFYREAKYSVPDQKKSGYFPGEGIFLKAKIQDNKEYHSFEHRFKERRREVGESIFLDRKESVVWSKSEKLLVNVVPDPSESESDGENACH